MTPGGFVGLDRLEADISALASQARVLLEAANERLAGYLADEAQDAGAVSQSRSLLEKRAIDEANRLADQIADRLRSGMPG